MTSTTIIVILVAVMGGCLLGMLVSIFSDKRRAKKERKREGQTHDKHMSEY